MIICEKCGNQDERTLYTAYGHLICKRCIRYQREQPVLDEIAFGYDESELSVSLTLTPLQKAIADQLLQVIQTHSVFLEAVCGAGKTEMMLPFLTQCFKEGVRVVWAIPRRQVVLEIAERLQKYYTSIKVVAVCEGYTEDLVGDLIVCTTHQLYRYTQSVDCLILDEVDAFPYANDPVLQDIAQRVYRKRCIYLSATIEANMKRDLESQGFIFLYCSQRPSQRPLPIPRLFIHFRWVNYLHGFYKIHKRNQRLLIFFPTIKMMKRFAFLTRFPCISSKTDNKEAILQQFSGSRKVLLTTSILERGVTFNDISVLVFDSDHPVFNVASLTQIAGRVERGMNPSKGEVIFYTSSKAPCVISCIRNIKRANDYVVSA